MAAIDVPLWDIEDEEFWQSTGRKVGMQNLLVSIPCLLCGFVVWLYWSMITTEMLRLGLLITRSQLLALAFIAGATLRIPSSYPSRIAGERNTILLTSSLLLVPAPGAGLALRNPQNPLMGSLCSHRGAGSSPGGTTRVEALRSTAEWP